MKRTSDNQDVYDQYIDAAVALVMEEHAAAMRSGMMAEPPTEPVPPALHERCEKLIQKRSAKARRKAALQVFFGVTRKIAIIALVSLSIGSVLFMTVDAIRRPVISFFLGQHDEYVLITGQDQEDATTNPVSPDQNDPLKGLLPEGYVLESCNTDSDGYLDAYYFNENGEEIDYSIMPSRTAIQVDDEDAASTRQIKIGDYDAILIEKNGYTLIWLNHTTKTVHYLSASTLTADEIVQLAETIVQ